MPITTTDARPSRARRRTHPMTPRLGVVLLPLFVAGCGLPPAVTIASLTIDAISLAMNEKTVTDYALSQIVQKDCSIWRGFTGDICIDADSTVAVAAADGQPTAGGADSAELVAIYAPAAPVSHSHVPPVRGKKAKSSRKAKAPKKLPVTISAVPAPAADDDAAAEADGSEQEEAPRTRVPEEPATSAWSSISVKFLLFGA